jgi:hypothetical protein
MKYLPREVADGKLGAIGGSEICAQNTPENGVRTNFRNTINLAAAGVALTYLFSAAFSWR